MCVYACGVLVCVNMGIIVFSYVTTPCHLVGELQECPHLELYTYRTIVKNILKHIIN